MRTNSWKNPDFLSWTIEWTMIVFSGDRKKKAGGYCGWKTYRRIPIRRRAGDGAAAWADTCGGRRPGRRRLRTTPASAAPAASKAAPLRATRGVRRRRSAPSASAPSASVRRGPVPPGSATLLWTRQMVSFFYKLFSSYSQEQEKNEVFVVTYLCGYFSNNRIQDFQVTEWTLTILWKGHSRNRNTNKTLARIIGVTTKFKEFQLQR